MESFNQLGIDTSVSLILETRDYLITKEKSILTPDEYTFYLTQNSIVRPCYLLGRYIAKKAIIKVNPQIGFGEIDIKKGVWGFPIIISKKIANQQVSISHTATAAAAICFPEIYPMGVDIEDITTNNMTIIRDECTENELSLYHHSSLSSEDFYLSLWTAKESLAKALKTGFRIPFNIFEISSATTYGNLVFIRFKHFSQFASLSATIDHLKISVVFPVVLKENIHNLLFKIHNNESKLTS